VFTSLQTLLCQKVDAFSSGKKHFASEISSLRLASSKYFAFLCVKDERREGRRSDCGKNRSFYRENVI
jgi:hypothetical protein